ncbi:sulfatase family protein [Aurantibacter aestuarii]|uniref:Sulfatase n=1 Tax=Aurantibacter aestuarii TaxID=1266046 RepID=A0A2T1N9F9_9FLAO|nr:sulfatase [Aurantibacter aestuarii]PSG88495.1 sulfatase [Aurantibacter aestuarii]
MKHLGLITLLAILLFGCNAQNTSKNQNINKPSEQPNIVWIVTEDISPTLSFYGDYTAKTPNLDALAKESMIYDNAFAVVGVCAPTRSSIITGMYPTSIGTMHMRTGNDVMSWGKREYQNKEETGRLDLNNEPIPQYSAVIPPHVKCYTEYLRAAGYYCTNNQKTDYQFAAPITAWDENNPKAHWRNTPIGKPFFSVFNINTTHESQLWKNNDLPLTVNPEDVTVPPYLPDNLETRKTIARHYSNVELMDAEVGEFINQLKADGLYENTIIFFYSDHGGPLPRQKREIYDSGLKVPFMVKHPNGNKGRTDELISFVDLAPTMLSLAGIKAPKHLEGQAFLGIYKHNKQRDYVFASSDRFDEFTDRIRAIRTKDFLYLKNDYPEKPKYKDVGYRKNISMMPKFLELKTEGELNKTQEIWFNTKTVEELYDVSKDPHNLNNLAQKSEYNAVLKEMRLQLKDQQEVSPDLGKMFEAEVVETMWPKNEQPITSPVKISQRNQLIHLTNQTDGSSIAYLFSDNPDIKFDYDLNWQLYTSPISNTATHKYLYVVAERIGFKTSDMLKINLKN